MRTAIRPFHLAALLLFAAAASPGVSAAQTAQTCLAAQLRAAGGACSSMTICYAKAMKKGVAVDAACIRAKGSMLALNFSEPEALATCLVEGQAASVAGQIADDVSTMATALSLDGGACAARKILALGKECHSLLRCQAMADGTSTTVDPACLASAGEALATAFAKAEKKGSCSTIGDRVAREIEVGALTNETHLSLRGTGTTTTTTTTSTSTSTVTIP